MGHDTLHALCLQHLHGIKVSQPFSLDAFAAAVAGARGRALHVLPLPGLDGSDGVSGAWAATDTADYILIDAAASGWHRDLIGLHEIGHVLGRHDAAGSGPEDLTRDSLSRAASRRAFGGSGRDTAGEQDAELTAWLLLAGLPDGSAGDTWTTAEDLASLRALRGMRDELAEAVPGAAAGPWADEIAGPGGDLRIRLVRRTAEIRDAALALRGYVPPGTITRGRRLLADGGLTGAALDAAAEACWLGLAARAARAGSAAREPAHLLPGSSTLRGEVRWLRQVAAAMRSPAVQTAAAQLAPPPQSAAAA